MSVIDAPQEFGSARSSRAVRRSKDVEPDASISNWRPCCKRVIDRCTGDDSVQRTRAVKEDVDRERRNARNWLDDQARPGDARNGLGELGMVGVTNVDPVCSGPT